MKKTNELGLTIKSVQLLLMQRAHLRFNIELFISRTLLKIFPEKFIRKFIFEIVFPLYHKLFLSHVTEHYLSSCEVDFKNLKPHLEQTNTACRVLDIGSGFSGVSIFLFQFLGKNTKFHLLDRNSITTHWKVGYHSNSEHFSSYNDFQLVKKFLKSMGLNERNIKTTDIETQKFPADNKFDVVISLLSMGYHYPVDTYADEIQRATSKGAKIFLDLRDGQNDLRHVEKILNAKASLINDNRNSKRYLLTRN